MYHSQHSYLLRYLILFFTFFCINNTLKSQPTNPFSAQPEQYFKDLDKYMNNAKRSDNKEAYDQLKENVETGKISQDNLQQIIAMNNIMLERKMNPYPHFQKYTQLINKFFSSTKTKKETFATWQGQLKNILLTAKKGDNKDFVEMVEFLEGLFLENMLYSSNSKKWYTTSNDYQLDTKDGKPILNIPNGSIKGKSQGDSIYIHYTKGYYEPLEHIWHGEKGRADWQRVGLDSGYVYAKFKNYAILFEKSEYKIDTATVYNYNFVKAPMQGTFIDKLSALDEDSKPYPKFISHSNNIKFESFADNVKIYGGLAMDGAKVTVKGEKEDLATLLFYRSNKDLGVKAKSEKFVIRKGDEIFSLDAAATVYFDKASDSIYHPGLNVYYKLKNNTLNLRREGEGVGKTSFYNSYENIEMLVDEMTWKLDQDKINFKMTTGGEQNSAFIESNNYFQANRYDKYQNIADYNIVSKIKQYSEENHTKTIDANVLAKYISPRFNLETIERTLFYLVGDGFIFYDKNKQEVIVKPKTFNYVLASAKLIDYDVIRIKSNDDSSNALLRLDNYNLNLQGVYNINVSDSQKVVFFPKKKKVVMKLNRDMDFAGTIIAGRTDLYGKENQFKYATFTVDLPILDSMLIFIPDPKNEDDIKPEIRPLNTTIEKLRGKLAIDGNNNKSGRVQIGEFPFVESLSDSYTYYDKPSTQKGVYTRDKIFFKLDPFRFDSLDEIVKSSVKFDGTFVSANIFPEFEEKIVVRPDYSLGFATKTPSKGHPLYGGKAKYFDKIDLSNKGILGAGRMEFQTTKMKQPDIVFFPDSMNAKVDSFVMKRRDAGDQFPNCTNENLYMHWIPKGDSLFVTPVGIPVKTPFVMKDWGATFNGRGLLSSKGFNGYGLLDWNEATLSSRNHVFKAMTTSADTADLELKTLDSTKVVFKIPNVKSFIDFDKQKGDFKSNEKDIPTDLPYNQYTTNMNQFNWDMKKRIIKFYQPEEDKRTIVFSSTRQDQEGLKFEAKGGIYDLNNYLLTCTGVKYIRVADAKVYPDSSIVYIEPEAKMRRLNNAVVRCDTMQEWHVMTKCTLDIISKNLFTGEGQTVYENNANEKYTIKLKRIDVKESEDKLKHNVFAIGDISADDKFKLDKKMSFKGKVRLNSDKQFLNFDGFAKFTLTNKYLSPQWFNFTDDINPENIIVQFNNPVNELGDTLSVGINYGVDTANLYTVFIDRLRNKRDYRVFQSKGLLRINEATKEYEIGDEHKIKDEKDRGTIFKLNDGTGKVSGEGRLVFGEKYQMVKVSNFGSFDGNINTGKYNFYSTILIDYFFNEKLSEALATSILNNNEAAEAVDYTNPHFDRYIQEYFTEKDYNKARPTLYMGGNFIMPKDFKSQWLFTNVNMVFDTTTNSFHSVGPLSLSHVGKKLVGKVIEKGWIEFGFKRGGEFFNIYLESELEDWIHLYYSKGTLYILSSDKDFNLSINAIKPDDRRTKNSNQQIFQYVVGTSSKKNSFIDKMEYAAQVASGKIKSGGFEETETEDPDPETVPMNDPTLSPPDPNAPKPDGTSPETEPKPDAPKTDEGTPEPKPKKP